LPRGEAHRSAARLRRALRRASAGDHRCAGEWRALAGDAGIAELVLSPVASPRGGSAGWSARPTRIAGAADLQPHHTAAYREIRLQRGRDRLLPPAHRRRSGAWRARLYHSRAPREHAGAASAVRAPRARSDADAPALSRRALQQVPGGPAGPGGGVAAG